MHDLSANMHVGEMGSGFWEGHGQWGRQASVV